MSRPPYNYGGPSRPAPKRKAPAYITIPDDDETPSTSHPPPKRTRPSTTTTTQRDDDYDDDAGAHDVIDLSQDSNNEYGEDWEHYGHIDGKVVGVRYYSGIATVGEQVLLKREPGNQVCFAAFI